jgi:4'-phosphopantetheinyl transferase
VSAAVDVWWADLAAVPAAPAGARRGLVRGVLARALGCDPAEIVLSRTAAGRPELERPRADLRFSVASSGTTALVAITTGRAVGVDVELAEHSAGLGRLGHLFLAPAEQERLAAHPQADRDLAALRLWTRKEALAKALGTGLRTDPAALAPDGDAAILATAPTVVAAIAVPGGFGDVRQRRWHWNPSPRLGKI